MDKFDVLQFHGLLKREVLEHKGAFIFAPLILGTLILVATTWLMNMVRGEDIAGAAEFLSVLFEGLSAVEMAPMFMVLAMPFVGMLYMVGFFYLINTLYQDRKELSILFWQSMPVSNTKTVLSKVVAIGVVAPIFYIAILFSLYVIGMIWLTIIGFGNDVQIAGLGTMFLAAMLSLVLVYLSIVVGVMWLFPWVGWLLLFSAFAKRSPIMWAIGIFILVIFLESFVFGSQYLGTWVDSRSSPAQYMVFSFQDVFSRLFSYDMLVGLLFGSILLVGAVYMRRFID